MTLPHESGTESDFERSKGHDSEQLSSSFVPAAPQQATEQEAVEQVVSDEQPVAWPPRGDNPLNGFHSEGYITLAFPTLLLGLRTSLHCTCTLSPLVTTLGI